MLRAMSLLSRLYLLFRLVGYGLSLGALILIIVSRQGDGNRDLRQLGFGLLIASFAAFFCTYVIAFITRAKRRKKAIS